MPTTAHPLYRAAQLADETYSATIVRVFGARATRWTLTPAQNAHPDVAAALRAKIAADDAWRQVLVPQRRRLGVSRLDRHPNVHRPGDRQ